MLNDQATILHGLHCFQSETSMRYPVSVEHNSVVKHGKMKTGGKLGKLWVKSLLVFEEKSHSCSSTVLK